MKNIIKDWAFIDFNANTLDLLEDASQFYVNLNNVDLSKDDVSVFGPCYKHERYNPVTTEFEDGHRIKTSPIEEFDIEEMKIVTETGSVYYLEDRSEEYTEFLIISNIQNCSL